MRWHILTGSYPPTPGGVADHARQAAEGLAARGESVTVFTPAGSSVESETHAGVEVVQLPDHFGWQSIRVLAARLVRKPDHGCVFVHYVPHAFGWKALNLLFVGWLWANRRRLNVWTMFHEVIYHVEGKQSFRHRLLERGTIWMAKLMIGASEKIFVSAPRWETLLRQLAQFNKPVLWLPIPSNIPQTASPDAQIEVRTRVCPNSPCLILGHFGTFGFHIASFLSQLTACFLVDHPEVRLLLIGAGSQEFGRRLIEELPACTHQVHCTGSQPLQSLADCVGACDLLIQPYPDGVNCRRTTLMAGLALGVPVITNLGRLTEPLWTETQAVEIVSSFETEAFLPPLRRLLGDADARRRLGARGCEVYQSQFSLPILLDHMLTQKNHL